MFHPLVKRGSEFRGGLLLAALLLGAMTTLASDPPAAREALWQKLQPFAQPPEVFAGKFGPYRSPLQFADGTVAKTPADWARRRAEILKTWHQRLGAWPPLVERPEIKKLEKVERDSYTEFQVQVQAASSPQPLSPGGRRVGGEGKWVDGYLLVPKGSGPFPAVLVPFYEPLTSIGRGDKGHGVGTHDYGLQLVKRGFVTLSIGTPGSLDKLGGDTRTALTKAGQELRRQPLTLLAYVAANCLTALTQMPQVAPQRIGIIGLSYGGKWAMFASCLDERFACAVWSDPGIVFNEKDSNVNYWEPWYLGYDPKIQRQPGVPSPTNPRTGLYKELIDAGEDLVDLHALMAPRPVLVSGGVQDPPRNWQALNHLVAVDNLLGYKHRAFLTSRKTHVPTAEALELELAFFEYFLKYASSPPTPLPEGERGKPTTPLTQGERGRGEGKNPEQRNTPTRPAVGTRGMVSTAHPLATQVGLDILEAGGNAFDAAVAVAAPRLSFVEPDLIAVDEDVPESVRQELTKRGHKVQVRRLGNAHGLTVEYDQQGRPVRFSGGSDPRGEGIAIGR
jgi:dienelactone hydrolase